MSDEALELRPAATLAALLIRSQHISVLTGAGVSAAAGLHTYRSPDNPWSTIQNCHTAEGAIAKSELLWSVWGPVHDQAAAAMPTATHYALTDMQRWARGLGKTCSILTQNIDGLHTKAGTDTIELHGSLGRVVCTDADCGWRADTATISRTAGKVPHCPRCSAVLRPDIVLIGETLSATARKAVVDAIATSQLLLVIGTSGTTVPVARIPAAAAGQGAVVYLVNEDRWEDMAAFDFAALGSADRVVPAAMAMARHMRSPVS